MPPPATSMTDEAYSPSAAAAVPADPPAVLPDQTQDNSKGVDEPSREHRSKKSKRRSRSDSRSRSRSRSRRHSRRDSRSRSRSRSRGRRHRSRSRSRSRRHRSRSGSRHKSRRHQSASPARSRSAERNRRSHRNGRSRSPSVHRSPPRKFEFRGRRRAQSTPPPDDPERDQRTVFVMQLAARLVADDLKEFFSAAGKVRDARIISNKNSRKSKGFAYVEFEDVLSIPKALAMSGQRLLGVPVMVQLSNAEKNRQAAAAAEAAKLLQANSGPLRIHVANIHPKLNETDIRRLFEIDGKDIQIELGTTPGTAIVTYKDSATARLMAEQLNGVEVADMKLQVTLLQNAPNPLRSNPYAQMNLPLALDEMGDGGLSMSRQSRHELMQKLSRESGVPGLTPQAGNSYSQFPPASQVYSYGVQVAPTMMQPVQMVARPAGPVGIPSACCVVKNMFDPASETEPDWDKAVEEDVADECRKHGHLIRVSVAKESAGYVYLRFATVAECTQAAKALDGRYFAQRQLSVEFIPEVVFNNMFP